MKKILIFASIFALSGCINAGGMKAPFAFDFLGAKTHSVDLYDDNGFKLVKTEKYNEIEPASGEIHRAFTGFSMFYDKTYTKSYYQNCFVKARMDGVLSSATIPSEIKEKDIKKLVGQVEIDDEVYTLLDADQESYVWMIKQNGDIHTQMGQLVGDELSILDVDFFPQPKDLGFEIIKETKMDQTMPTTGFEIKFNGMKNNTLNFLVLNYSDYIKDKGEFDALTFNYKQNINVKISGVKFKVLYADEEKIDYIILD